MRYIKFLFVSLIMLLATTGRVSADDKCEPDMYMFGYAYSFNDSTLYLTAVQKVHDVWVRPRNGFIIERETYSKQLQTYFDKDGVRNMTCGISFSKKEKKIHKKFAKLKARFNNKFKNIRIVNLSEADFVFTSFVPLQIDTKEHQSKKK